MHSPEYEVNWVDQNLQTTHAQYYYEYYNNDTSTTNIYSNTNDGVYYSENPYQNEVHSYETYNLSVKDNETYNLKTTESMLDEYGNYKESGYYSETQNSIIVVNEYPDNQKNIAKPMRNQTCLNDLRPVPKCDSL
jgi:hypothetical protein